jgi:HEAT repeat protein
MTARRYNQRYENDPTPSREVVERYRAVIREDDHDESLTLVTYRGGEEEFALGREYCASDDAGDRETGAYILGQLGWSDCSFLEETVRILIPLLDDPDDQVVYAATSALGHRNDPSAIPALIEKADHGNSLVRFGVVQGLSAHEDPRAIEALITLAADEDAEVRNWAVFGIGSQVYADTPEIREALRRALSDPDLDVRGEALVGLAQRGDERVVTDLLDEWMYDEVSLLSIEAAEVTGDPRSYERLNHFARTLPLEGKPYHAKSLAAAIATCSPK